MACQNCGGSSRMCRCYVAAGENVAITGSGTAADPFVINATGEISDTSIVPGDNIAVTGSGTADDPYVVSATVEQGPKGDQGDPGPEGPQGDDGPVGPEGDPGTQWFNGDGAPAEPVAGANPGDYYIDNASGNYYVLQGA